MNMQIMKEVLEKNVGLTHRCRCGKDFDLGATLLQDKDYGRARFNNFICDKCYKIESVRQVESPMFKPFNGINWKK